MNINNQTITRRESVILLRHLESGYSLVIPERFISTSNTQEAGSFSIRTEFIPNDLRIEKSRFVVVATSEVVDPENLDRDLREICRKVIIERLSD